MEMQEEALLEYIERYGLLDKARRLFAMNDERNRNRVEIDNCRHQSQGIMKSLA